MAPVDVELRIKRYNPDCDTRPHWETYGVRAEPTDRLLDALHTVRWEQDGTLAFRRSCGHGVCGSDAMMINGANALACIALIRDTAGPTGGTVTVEAIRGLPLIKDLVVDMEPFFAQYRSVMPYLVATDDPGAQERRQSPEDRERYDDTTKCILCAACTTACPVFWGNSGYVGPAAIVNAHRFVFDSRDGAASARLDLLNQRSGAWSCRTALSCTEACPRGIKVTAAIGEVKRAIRSGGA